MKYELKQHFCIYLNILGYSKRIENITEDELQDEFKHFIRCVVTENDFLEELSKIIKYKIKLFSDNIFIALPVTKETIADFHLVLQHIIDYQKSLIQSNYFIRGGITKGMLYFDEKIIWGQALVDAVKLEKDAEYPFINISNDIIDFFIDYDLLSDTNELLSIPLVEIKEGKYYLDYLQTTIHYQDGKPSTYYSFLQMHQNLVRNNFIISENKIFEKYKLLAKYHNEFCKNYKNELPPIQYYIIKESITDDVTFKRKYLKVIV